MSPELTKKLLDKYPTVMKDYAGDPRQTCMAWGIGVGDGWFNILDELCAVLEKHGVVAMQIKEKFGTLRFYINNLTPDLKFDTKSEEVWDAIDKAERKSATTCEQCGAEGKLRKGGWLVTLCDKCHKEREGT